MTSKLPPSTLLKKAPHRTIFIFGFLTSLAMLFPILALLALSAVQLVSVRAASSCSAVQGISSPAACMSVAVSRKLSAAVFSKKGCFICQPFRSQLYPSHCGGESGCGYCVGYQFKQVSNPMRHVLLLRTHKSTKVSPYTLFMSGASNPQVLLNQIEMSNTASHKSPLFDLAYEIGVTQVEVQMLTSSGEVGMRLRFALKGDLKTDNWFNKDRLVASFPWSVQRIKGDNYNYFSIKGADCCSVLRRWYINKNWGGCSKDRGYMIVNDKEVCKYLQVPKPAYFWCPNPDIPWMQNKCKQAHVFQVIGILDEKANAEVYTSS